jgi:hypothetical protein
MTDPLRIELIREVAILPHDEIWAVCYDPNATVEDLERVIASIYGYAELEEE